MSDVDAGEEKPKKKKPKSPLRKVSAFLVVLALLGAGVLGAGYIWLNNHFQSSVILAEEKVVEIPSGSGVATIAALLAREGVIENPLTFRLMLRLKRLDKQLKAGEFRFLPGVTPAQVVNILRGGKTVLYNITFPEGLTSVEMISLLNAQQGLDEVVMQVPPEGSILPETYSYHKGMKRQDIVVRMKEHMQETLMALWEKRQPGLPLKTPQEALVLASIVEKETGVSSERAKVAGVFINRLEKRMRLQTDPSVVYGITLGQVALGRPLSRKDLKTPTPYNTYTNYGLPPTPICNPGRASLEAVLNPDKTDALYFVADGSGGHAFAKTLNEHNRNVARWRRLERISK